MWVEVSGKQTNKTNRSALRNNRLPLKRAQLCDRQANWEADPETEMESARTCPTVVSAVSME